MPARPRILDTGCGSGEMLLRALWRDRGARGLGVDLDADAIADARRRATDLPAEFEVRDAATVDGAFDVVINVGSSHVHVGFPAALEALSALAPVVLYGEGFWRRPPSHDFLASLGGATEDELADLDGLRGAVRAAGLEIVRESLASEGDWHATRRPWPPTPSATAAAATRFATHDGSASGARCQAPPRRSASRSWCCVAEQRVRGHSRGHAACLQA